MIPYRERSKSASVRSAPKGYQQDDSRSAAGMGAVGGAGAAGTAGLVGIAGSHGERRGAGARRDHRPINGGDGRDAASWVWELASHLFPYAEQILDWYHLTEHLWTAPQVVHGEGTPETSALVEQWKTGLWEGRSEGVGECLRELVAAGKEDKDDTLRKCADYLLTHQHRLRYRLFREMGWPLG